MGYNNVMAYPKEQTFYEELAQLLEKPGLDSFRNLLQRNFGELSCIDFKEGWPAFPKVARHLLALANSGGGCIVFGVTEKDSGGYEPKGLDKLEDKAQVKDGIEKFMPSVLIAEDYFLLDLPFPADSEHSTLRDKKFQLAVVVDDSLHLPFISTGDADEIREDAVYVRRGTSSEEANYEELQTLIDRRIEAGYSFQREMNLQAHLDQLNVLYEQIPTSVLGEVGGLFTKLVRVAVRMSTPLGPSEPNPAYPKEDFEGFVLRMITLKKRRIQIELDVRDLKED